jgi:heme exporter protein C
MRPLSIAFIILTLALLGYSTYQALLVAPTEQTMGDVQRIFYYHAPTAWVAGLCFFVNFLDVRLTSTLVLWLIYVSYLILRRYATGGQTQVLAAAVAIFGFVDVPIVYMSIRWFRTQHPSPVIAGGENSGLDPAMWHAFLWNLVAFTCVGIVFVAARYRLQKMENLLEDTHARMALEGSTQ